MNWTNPPDPSLVNRIKDGRKKILKMDKKIKKSHDFGGLKMYQT